MANNLINDLDRFSVSDSKYCDVEECKQYLTRFTNSLTVLTQNIRSIYKNFDNLSIYLQRVQCDFDVIILTECWLNHKYNLPTLAGYNRFSSKANYNQNDGVVIYAKNNLQITVEEPLLLDCNRQLIKIGSDVVILALYRPPSFKKIDIFLESLNNLLSSLSSVKHIILTGDINININLNCSETTAQDYLNLCSFHGLLPAHSLPTHLSGSCLDHVMLKTYNPSFTLVNNSSLTDHSAVLLSLCLKIPRPYRTQLITKLNVNKLEQVMCAMDFDPVYQSADANSALLYVIEKLQQAIIDNTVTVKLSRKYSNIKPWITPGLIRCMKHRDRLHSIVKLNPENKIAQCSYKRYRNFCNTLLKKVKNSYEKTELQRAGKDSKKVWKQIKNLTYASKQSATCSSLLRTHSSPVLSINNANNFFVNVGKNLADKISSQISQGADTNVRVSNNFSVLKSFVMLETDSAEVETIIAGLRDDCAVGWDNIPNKILKQFKHILAPPLAYIFQRCLSDGVFPKCLKKAVVIPIYKSGDKNLITNYRPISLLPSLSKILEKIMNNRLMKYLEKNSLLSSRQFGFRPKLSTSDAVHQLTDYITRELDKGNHTIGIFLDLAKAFDTVSTPILLHKLENLGIRGTQLKLFASYLSDRCQCVKVGDVISNDQFNTSFGVPQGSILGPTLFLIYINDLCNLDINSGTIISYADDTALIFSADTERETYERAQSGFNIIKTWLHQHMLTLNADKTKYIKFFMGRQCTTSFDPIIYAHHCSQQTGNNCDCPQVLKTNNIKYLGILIDEKLSFKLHIEALSNRVRKLMFVFKKLRSIADSKLINLVYSALCQSLLTYCITSWGGAAKTHLLKLERAQRAILKVSTFRSFLYPTSLLYKTCNVLTVRQLFIMSTVLKQHQALPYSTENINKRRKDIVCTDILQTKHAFSSRFFMFLGPLLYNRLNSELCIYPLGYKECKKCIENALQKLSYDDTENLLMVLR